MQTIAMPERASGLVWLEHFPEAGGAAERTTVDRFPFVIGRSETADLQVGSSRVSREHAVLVQEQRELRIRDLDSTNGTFVNGQRVHEAVLHHGDMLVIANVEFTFGSESSESPQRLVTQLLGCPESDDLRNRAPDFRHEVRRLHEVLLGGCVHNAYDAIVSLGEGQAVGYEARPSEDTDFPLEASRFALTAAWPVAARVRHLSRATAVDESRTFPGDPAIFVRIEPCDLGVQGLVESVGGLRRLLPDDRRLVAVLPCEAMQDLEQAEALLRPLRDSGVGTALDAFTGKPADSPRPAAGQFDYVKLPAPLVRGIQQSSDRQRTIQAAVRAGREGGWEVIATGIRSKEERSVCDGLGCSLGQGPLFANLLPADVRRPRGAHAV